MPQIKPMSNELFALAQKKTERLRQIDEEELTNPQQFSVEEEFKRIEKLEGETAHRILPEISRLAGEESKKIDKDIYNYIVKGRYIDPSRRMQMYEWIRNTVFKYDEFVVALEQLDEKKSEFIKKQMRIIADLKEKNGELSETNERFLQQISDFKKVHGAVPNPPEPQQQQTQFQESETESKGEGAQDDLSVQMELPIKQAQAVPQMSKEEIKQRLVKLFDDFKAKVKAIHKSGGGDAEVQPYADEYDREKEKLEAQLEMLSG